MLIATFLFTLFALPLALAMQGVPAGGPCNISANGLDPSTHRFMTECDAMSYCSADGTCNPKGCRKDTFPYGYGNNALPPMCPNNQFCPDEEDSCLPLVDVGGQCQLNRDDECAPPPNWRALSSTLNSNGSICLSFVCQYANVSLGQPCIVENTAYTGYGRSGQEFNFVVSRDDCQTPGGYCDGSQRVCMATKDFGAACAGDKECHSYNCLSSGTCGPVPGEPHHIPLWEYIVSCLGIIILIASTSTALFLLHRHQRTTSHRTRQTYWSEQIQLRNSLFALHRDASEYASRRGTLYSLAGQESASGVGFGSRVGTPGMEGMGEGSVRRFSGESEVGLINRAAGGGRVTPGAEPWRKPL